MAEGGHRLEDGGPRRRFQALGRLVPVLATGLDRALARIRVTGLDPCN
jgi:hypothetical protein